MKASSGGSRPKGGGLTLTGVGVSPGISMGSALIMQDHDEVAVVFSEVPARSVKQEVARLHAAFEAAKVELAQLKDQVSSEVGPERARIFEAQIYMLADDALVGEASRTVERERVNAEWALRETRDRVIGRFKDLGEEYFRDRLYDVKDVTKRVARHLSGAPAPARVTGHGIIVVATDLTPSEAAIIDTQSVKGFVLEVGGRTSHTAILAKSLGIPAIVGVTDAVQRLQTGTPLLLDGAKGLVLVEPDPEAVRGYLKLERTRVKHERMLRRERSKPAKTSDGHKLFLQANIELPDEVEGALSKGAEGIGLYRTEFLYLSQKDGHEPSEDEHFTVYRAIATRVKPFSAIVRTLDLGGDKLHQIVGAADQRPSALGLRALRLCLAHQDMFRTQLRAILRASHYGRIKILLPFVTSVDEVRQAKAILRECMAELRKRQEPFNEAIEVGAMVEIPAAAMTADLLAREVSFFSIGTNDLIQYLLAVDRADERVSHLYEPLHPALIRMLDMVIRAAHAHSVRVGMCGEMAADPLLAPLLVGLGLDELSMDPGSVPAVKYVVRAVSFAECTVLAREILALQTPRAIRRRLADYLAKRVPPWLVGESVDHPEQPASTRKEG